MPIARGCSAGSTRLSLRHPRIARYAAVYCGTLEEVVHREKGIGADVCNARWLTRKCRSELETARWEKHRTSGRNATQEADKGSVFERT